jgi:hypothetical protein
MGGILFLVLVGLYFAFCVWLSKRLTKKIRSGSVRKASISVLVVVLILLPGIDGILGNLALESLCDAESKTEVFGIVYVPEGLLDKDKRSLRLDNSGNIDWPAMRPYLVVHSKETIEDRRLATIRRVTRSLLRVSDGREVARQTNFYFDGSWYFSVSGQGFGAGSCIAKPSVDSLLSVVLKSS